MRSDAPAPTAAADQRDRRRQVALRAAIVLLLAVAATGILTRDPVAPDRAASLEQRLRCPVCAQVSIADSPAGTAQAMRTAVAQQVAAGRSDAQILDWFQARYGRWVLLDPVQADGGWWLWALPAAGGALGVWLVVARARRRPPQEPVTEPPTAPVAGAPVAARNRRLGLVLAPATVAAVLVLVATQAAPADGPRTAAPTDPPAAATVDVAALEQRVRTAPQDVTAQVELADRYLQEDRVGDALPHYRAALEADPGDARALAGTGWLLFRLGRYEEAQTAVERARQADPDLLEALWFEAVIALDGRHDVPAAVAALEDLSARPELPADLRDDVDATLARARAGLTSPTPASPWPAAPGTAATLTGGGR